MASKFPEEETPCQGIGCTKTSGATYRVEENQPLCDECVSKKAGSIKPKLDWICEEHDEPIKYFCSSHNKEACQSCVTISHRDCQIDAAKTVLKEMKRKLEELQNAAPQGLSDLEKRRDQIGQVKHEVDTHLKLVEEDVGLVIEDEMRKEKEKEQARAIQIERETEEEIRKIKARGAERLKRNLDNGETRRHLLEEKRHVLLFDVKKHRNSFVVFVDDKMNALKEHSNGLQQKMYHIELLSAKEDKEVLKGSQELISATGELLEEYNLDDKVEETTLLAKTLGFFHGERESVAGGRIDGFYGIWNLEKACQIVAEKMYMPTLCGCLNEDEIVFREITSHDLHLANLKTGEMAMVEHEGKGTTRIEECVPLNEDQMVCLNVRNWKDPRRGDTGDHFISIFDKHSWQLVKDLPCPWNSGSKRSHIDIDKDGNVIAARECQREVHVINPNENTITQTISWPKENGSVSGRIHALSAGDIAAKIQGYHGGHKFVIIDRAGVMKVAIHDDDWNHHLSRFTVDPLTDMLYITYGGNWCKFVDQVSSDGVFKAKRIVDFEDKEGYASHSYVIPSGRLVSTDGEKILVFKK